MKKIKQVMYILFYVVLFLPIREAYATPYEGDIIFSCRYVPKATAKSLVEQEVRTFKDDFTDFMQSHKLLSSYIGRSFRDEIFTYASGEREAFSWFYFKGHYSYSSDTLKLSFLKNFLKGWRIYQRANFKLNTDGYPYISEFIYSFDKSHLPGSTNPAEYFSIEFNVDPTSKKLKDAMYGNGVFKKIPALVSYHDTNGQDWFYVSCNFRGKKLGASFNDAEDVTGSSASKKAKTATAGESDSYFTF